MLLGLTKEVGDAVNVVHGVLHELTDVADVRVDVDLLEVCGGHSGVYGVEEVSDFAARQVVGCGVQLSCDVRGFDVESMACELQVDAFEQRCHAVCSRFVGRANINSSLVVAEEF